jgi:hypothetical protein
MEPLDMMIPDRRVPISRKPTVSGKGLPLKDEVRVFRTRRPQVGNTPSRLLKSPVARRASA